MMFRSIAGSQPAAPGQGRSNPNNVTPYLTHLVTHHGQLTLTPPQNAGRIRKGGKKNPDRPRVDRRRDGDEPRFNTAVPSNPRGASRRGNNASGRTTRAPVPPPNMPRDSMIPDYPPPSFQEALMTPPFIPPPIPELPSEQPPPDDAGPEAIHNTSSAPPADDTRGLSRAGGPPQPPVLTVQTAVGPSASPPSSPLSQQTVDPQSGSSGSDESSGNSSSLEIVNHQNATDGWEADTQRGVPLDIRIHSELHRLRIAESTTNLSLATHVEPSHLGASNNISSSSSHQCTHCGSPKPVSISKRQLPPQSSPEVTEDEPDNWSPPSSPKSKKGWKKLFAPIVIHDAKSIPESPLSPLPKSPTGSTFTLLQNAWASTLTLASTTGSPSKTGGNPSPSGKRRDSIGVRRLFASKGKERELSPPEESEEEPWEVVNRASVLYAQEQDVKTSPRSMTSFREANQDWDSAPSSASSPHFSQRPRLGGSPYATTPFLNRPVRHPAQSGSTLALPFNQSVVSLAHSAAGPSAVNSPVSDPGSQKRVKRPPPPPPPPRRKAMSTTMKPNASVVHLPLLDIEAVASPLEQRQVSSPVHSTTNIVSSPPMPRPSPSLPSLRPSSRDGIEQYHTLANSAPATRLPSPFEMSTATLVHRPELTFIPPSSSTIPSVPLIRYPPPASYVPAPGPMTAEDSVSTISISTDMDFPSPPGTPTTPTHHYRGRPLPQPPRQPSPLRRAAMTAPLPPVGPDMTPASEYSHFTDLDLLASQMIEGDHDGQHYDDLLRVSEFAGPANTQDPFVLDSDALKVPPAGRVQVQRRRTMRDGRVKLKLTLMGSVVDKCGICLSQFKDTEVACLGTSCPHAFHEYCLKRWVVRSRTCPLCRAMV